MDPVDLKTPLYDVVDADALDQLVSSMSQDGVVSFEYHGFKITVRGDGTVELD